MSEEKSVAHVDGMNWVGNGEWPDGLVDWRPAAPPDLSLRNTRHTTGRLRSCGYCGSMHPTDLAAALAVGAKAHWADFKYGWPHKMYVEGIPNPHAGMMESRFGAGSAVPTCPKTNAACESGRQDFYHPVCECMKQAEPTEGFHESTPVVRMQSGFRPHDGKPNYSWHEAGRPAKSTTDGKFYTVHLKDATDDEKHVIHRAMGLRFDFSDGKVTWCLFEGGH